MKKCLMALVLVFSFSAYADGCPAGEKDIVDTAVANGNFKTLVAAVTAAELVDTLKSPGPFTVFAPTDAAFAKLPAGLVDSLLADPKGQLTDILLYHVAGGDFKAKDVLSLTSVPTVQGGLVDINKRPDGLYLNDSKVIMTDIKTSNGTIHVIDAVLIP